jgi:hypothetical protein
VAEMICDSFFVLCNNMFQGVRLPIVTIVPWVCDLKIEKGFGFLFLLTHTRDNGDREGNVSNVSIRRMNV